MTDTNGEILTAPPEGFEHVGWLDIAGNLWPVEPWPDGRSADRPVFAPVAIGK